MTIYLLAAAFAILFTVAGIAAIARQQSALYALSAIPRPSDRAPQENAPTPPIAAHRGDYRSLDAGSIKGSCSHV